MIQKTVRLTVFVLLILLISGIRTFAGPEQENGSWYYRNDSGVRVRNALIRIDGNLYYFGSDGTLVTDGPVEAEGDRYYCSEGGRCLTGQWKKCRFPGENAEYWHYFLNSGKAFETGWLQIGDERYHFSDRHMDHGWYREETNGSKEAVYYLGTEDGGKAAVGWLAWKGEETGDEPEQPVGWYYFRENGQMVRDTELEIGSSIYAFNANGTMAVGFCRITADSGSIKEKYFDRRTGCRAEGWMYLTEEGERNEGWYYFSEGEAVNPERSTKKLSEDFGAAFIDGSWYGFDRNGRMITGLYKHDERYYYFGTDGKMLTGSVRVPGEESGDKECRMLFLEEGTAPPVLGASAEGIVNGFLYKSGIIVCAEEDKFEQIELEIKKIRQSYVVDQHGKVIRAGTVTLKNGQKMKIIKQEDGWKLAAVTD